MINATVSRMSNGGWLFTWAASTSPYAIWLDGKLIDSVVDEEYDFSQPGYEETPPPLEIVEDGDVAESSLYPPFVIVQWRGLTSAVAYVVDEFVGAAWVTRATVQETRKGYYTWRSPAKDDDSTLQFRVTPVDIRGNSGTPLTFSMTMCRNPAPPEVSIDFNSAGDIVVSGV